LEIDQLRLKLKLLLVLELLWVRITMKVFKGLSPQFLNMPLILFISFKLYSRINLYGVPAEQLQKQNANTNLNIIWVDIKQKTSESRKQKRLLAFRSSWNLCLLIPICSVVACISNMASQFSHLSETSQ
jgi:hypothetical protein